MCGIYGLVSHHGRIDKGDLVRRRDLLTHRGPDDAGVWQSADGRAALAHRRLAVLDLTQSGHQPMVSEDGRCAIVFNGEVYNYQELRSELEKIGHRFRSASDTEVVLNAYREWGEKCVGHFNGMFAFAIYDARHSARGPLLFFARDRAGKKPFYYSHDGMHFEFASELKAIGERGRLSARALNYYLALGYVPNDLCLAEGVNKLPPAHAARFLLETHSLEVWRYWDLPPNQPDTLVSGEQLADRAQELLIDAVGLRLVSDVPLGVLLSGGLDSSLVVAAAAQQSAKPIQTFTVAFPGSHYDESAYAERVARHFGTEHHVLEVPRPSLDFLNDLSPFIDEPIADSSLLPTFMVSQLTRKHVTVALGGDGGDELFGGYSHYETSLRDSRRFGWIPSAVLSKVARLALHLPAGVRGRNRLASWRAGPLEQMIWGSSYFDAGLRQRILDRDFIASAEFDMEEPEKWLLGLFRKGRDTVDSMTRADFGSVLPDDYLVKIDRASMAVGLEMRAPLLDHRLVEFAFSKVPSDWKVKNGETRRIERILARRMLPPDLDINRKQGFSIPLDNWLRADRCEAVWKHCESLPDAISKAELARLVAGELKGRANGARLYALMMLGIAARNLAYMH